jgi:hypothetical protein
MPVKFTWKTQALIGLCALLCIGVIGGAVFLLQTQSYGPTELLPADKTVAYFERIDKPMQDRLGTYVPWLTAIPLNEERVAIALVRLQNNQLAWIRFASGKNGENGITASNPEALTLLKTVPALSSDSTFRALSRVRSAQDSFAYLLPGEASIELPSGIQDIPHTLAFSILPNEVRVAWIAEGSSAGAMTIEPKTLSGKTVLGISAGNLKRVIERTMTLAADDKALAYEAAARGWFSGRFGEELSLSYDLGNLLDGPVNLLVLMNGESQITILEGRNDDAKDIIDRLHAAASSSLKADRFTRTYDDQFTVDTLRKAETNEAEAQIIDNWHIRSTEGEQPLYSAIRGDDFILSSDIEALRMLIDAPAQSFGRATGLKTAAGIIDMAAAESALQSFLPGENLPIPHNIAKGGIIRWELGYKGNISVLRLY